MLNILNPLRELNLTGVLFRVFLAVLCGSVIGLERSSKNRPAGFRTHVLVSLGATTASMTGHYMYLVMGLPDDITRMGSQIIAGLGFLGAGTILVTRHKKVKGLTTAAGLWTMGIIGLTIGAGFYEGSILCTILVMFTQLVLANFVTGMRTDSEVSLSVIFSEKDALDQMMRYCKDKSMSIRRLRVKSFEDGQQILYRASIVLHAPWNAHIDALIAHIHGIHGIETVELLSD